jgi:dolichol-phosphate mannosyltransferase
MILLETVSMNSNTANHSVTFVVPALNEEARIAATVDTVLQAATVSTLSSYEIVLVNDGSSDNTGPIMDQLASQNPNIKVVHNPHNLNLGGAYKRALAVARCDYLVLVPGDNAMPVTSLSLILSHVGDADLILLYHPNTHLRPMGRRIGSWGFTQLINLLFGQHVKYYNAMVPRRELLNKITITTNSYAFQAEAVLKLIRSGCAYVEVPIPIAASNADHSAAIQPKKIVQVLKTIAALVAEIHFRKSAVQ